MKENVRTETVGAEVYEILRSVPKKEYYKIPKEITSYFEQYKNHNINTKIDLNKSYLEQEVSQEARDIIFCISLNYWLTSEQKREAMNRMKLNEKEYNEKYSRENLFKNIEIKTKKKVQSENTSKETFITKHKEPLLRRIINQIKEKLHIK